MRKPRPSQVKTLNVAEASELLQVTVATLYNWLSQNRHDIHATAYKVGGRWLFFQSELVDWIKQHPGKRNERRRK